MNAKVLLTLILCIFAAIGYTQKSNSIKYPYNYANDTNMDYPFAYATYDKDTLYLATNSMGHMTHHIWETDTATFTGIIPVFIWKDPEWFSTVPRKPFVPK